MSSKPLPDLFVETQPLPLPHAASSSINLDLDLGFVDGPALPSEASADFPSTNPAELVPLHHRMNQRALVVVENSAERIHWRARMALVNLVWMDEAVSTAQAMSLIESKPYGLIVVSCESMAIDPVAVVEAFHHANERGLMVVTGVSPDDLPLDDGEGPSPPPTGWRGRLKAIWKGEDLQSRFHHSTAFSAGHYAHQLRAPLNPVDMDAVLREWQRRLTRKQP